MVENGNGRAAFTVDKVTVFSVNVTNAKAENVSAGTDATLDAKELVLPDKSLKILKLCSIGSHTKKEMLHLIFKNRTYDMAIAYNFSDMIQFYNKLLGGRTTDIVSKFDASRAAYQEAIDNAIATFTQQ